MTRGLTDDSYVLELRLASTGGVARSFEVLSGLTAALESMDQHLALSASLLISTVLTIEDIEFGSIRLRLKTLLESIDDDGIKELDIKKVIGGYLVRAKYRLIALLEDRPALNQLQAVEIQSALVEVAHSAGLSQLPTYSPPSVRQIAGDIEAMQQALAPLTREDSVVYISQAGRARFNQGLQLSAGDLEALLTKETLTSTSEMILRVKKLDLLGDSQWEFRYDGKSLNARLADYDWLQRFRARQVAVLPGDSFRAMVERSVAYSFDNEVMSVRYVIRRILEVMPCAEVQTWLTLTEDED